MLMFERVEDDDDDDKYHIRRRGFSDLGGKGLMDLKGCAKIGRESRGLRSFLSGM